MKKDAKEGNPQEEGQPVIPGNETASDNTTRPPLDKPIPARQTEENPSNLGTSTDRSI